MANLVAIVGRPNVGKSTLFNRLTKTRSAIVSDTAGTTRDRQYGKVDWNGREFSIVDTGGWVVNSEDIFEDAIRRQVLIATEEANLVLFVVDVQTGLTDWDEDVAQILRKSKVPIILVVNKVDKNEQQYDAAEFYSLGLGEPFCISSSTGSGTGDLLDEVINNLKAEVDESLEDGIPRFAVVGRPNAGKSSLLNNLLNKERAIVTEIEGTTRDSIEEDLNINGINIKIIDTAGIRETDEKVEKIGIERAITIAEKSDLIIAIFDISKPFNENDLRILEIIKEKEI